MITEPLQWTRILAWPFMLCAALVFSHVNLSGLETETGKSKQDKETLSGPSEERAQRREVAWLGLSTEEASEALIAQLGLDPAIGLLVIYVTAESPAAQAGLQKHDVLVEFDGQPLAHPAQLRKLVQSRQIGETAKLAYFRAGKKQSAKVTLGKTTPRLGMLGDEYQWQGDLRELQKQLRDLPVGDTVREQMKNLRESLGRIRIDHEEIRKEIRRSLEQARKSMQEVLRQTTNTHKTIGASSDLLEDLARDGIELSKDATVTLRNTGSSVNTVVKTDSSGSYLIIAHPTKRLVAHDKNGRVIFEGEIETPEQQAKVPRDLWLRIEPLLRSLEANTGTPQLEAEGPAEVETY
jgi:hypothetical protein